jgi:hypothetical protein
VAAVFKFPLETSTYLSLFSFNTWAESTGTNFLLGERGEERQWWNESV